MSHTEGSRSAIAVTLCAYIMLDWYRDLEFYLHESNLEKSRIVTRRSSDARITLVSPSAVVPTAPIASAVVIAASISSAISTTIKCLSKQHTTEQSATSSQRQSTASPESVSLTRGIPASAVAAVAAVPGMTLERTETGGEPVKTHCCWGG